MPVSASTRAWQVMAYAVLLVLTAQATIAGAVLVPLRIAGVPAPVGLLIALLVGPACWIGAGLVGARWGAAGPGLLWLGLVLPMMTLRREGDLVVDGSLRGLAFLLVGSVAAAVATGAWSAPATRTTRITLRARRSRDTSRGGVAAG